MFFYIMYKLFFSILATSMLALCCTPPDNYMIKGNAGYAHDGDTVYLFYSRDGKERTIVGYSIVTDKTFTIRGNTEGEGIYYLGYKYDGDFISTLFFLEKGEIQACIGKEKHTIKGTPLNDTNRRVNDSVEQMMAHISNLEAMSATREYHSPEEMTRDGISIYRLNEKLYCYLKRVVSENIGNLYGLFMLVMYNGLFNEDEFNTLLSQVPARYTDDNNNSLYATAMEMKAQKAKGTYPIEP